MSVPVKYRDSIMPKLYVSAPTPPNLSFKDYKAWMVEWTTVEEHYDEAINRHKDWKTMRVKEAWVEKLKQNKLVWELKVEALKQEKIEAERKVEEQRQEEEWLQLEAENEKELALEREKQEATECQRLAELKEQEEKEKEKENEANKLALQAAGAPSVSDRDTEVDPADPKMAAMAELKKRRKNAKENEKADVAEPRKRKFWSASVVVSEGEAGGAPVGPLSLKRLKTEPAPQAKDKVLTGNGM